MATACLLGAANKTEAAGLVNHVTGTGPSVKSAVWLRDLYPPDDDAEWLGSLRPDRLAELLVARELASETLAEACLADLDERQARHALVLLARASAEHEVAKRRLESALLRFSHLVGDLRRLAGHADSDL